MLNPIGHAQNPVLDQKFPDRQFLGLGPGDPIVDVVGDLQRRNILVPIFLETFEGDGAIPFLPAHREKFLRRERQQRDVFEKEQIGIAAERGLLWQRGQSFL